MGYPYHKFFNFCYLDEEPESKCQIQLNTTKAQWKGKDPDIQDELWLKTPLQKEDEKEVYSFLDCHLNWYQAKGGNAEEFFNAIKSTWDGSGNYEHEATAQAYRPALKWIEMRKRNMCKLCAVVWTGEKFIRSCYNDLQELKILIETHRDTDNSIDFKEFIEEEYQKAKKEYQVKLYNKRKNESSSIKVINPHPDPFSCIFIDKAFSILEKEHKKFSEVEYTFENWKKGLIEYGHVIYWYGKKAKEQRKIEKAQKDTFDFFFESNLLALKINFVSKYNNSPLPEQFLKRRITEVNNEVDSNPEVRDLIIDGDERKLYRLINGKDYRSFVWAKDKEYHLSFNNLSYRSSSDHDELFISTRLYFLIWLKELLKLDERERQIRVSNFTNNLKPDKKHVALQMQNLLQNQKSTFLTEVENDFVILEDETKMLTEDISGLTEFEDLFINRGLVEPCIDILRNLDKPLIGENLNYVGGAKTKSALCIWMEELHRWEIIKFANDKTWTNLLNRKFSNLEMTKDGSLFRKSSKRAEKKYRQQFKVLISRISQNSQTSK